MLWKLVVIAFACTGVYLQAKLDGGLFKTYVFLYFTIISNMCTAAIFSVIYIFQASGKKRIPKILITLKYMFTCAMTLTLIVSICLLAPFKTHADIFSLRNLCLHIFAPAAAVIDFWLFDNPHKLNIKASLKGVIVPLFYVIITLLISIKGITYSNGTMFPYYFLDYHSLGWLKVIWWMLLIAVISLVSSFILTAIKIIIKNCQHK